MADSAPRTEGRARAGGSGSSDEPDRGSSEGGSGLAVRILGLLLTVFVLAEVNYPSLAPQAQLAAFLAIGLPIGFLVARRARGFAARLPDWIGLIASAAVGLYVFYWSGLGPSLLGDRAGAETGLDIGIGVVGLVVVLFAAWRVLGPALPILTGLFLLHAALGPHLPDLLFPHRGYSLSRIASQGFLQSQGVFGIALRVMFTYVFLFVVFGAVLQQTGATRFITGWARRLLIGTAGGSAKVSVFANALMGSLSGSAVADAATTGTLTIPLMRSTGFSSRVAAGITAAASSGAALVPPVMGAGAYMMLELVAPPVSYLEVIRAAVLPAVLYYAALFLIVHAHARRTGLGRVDPDGRASAGDSSVSPRPDSSDISSGLVSGEDDSPAPPYAGVVFFLGLGTLIGALVLNFTVFRAASLALAAVVATAALHPATRLTWARLGRALAGIARGAAPLVAASAAVGIILGMVTLTGIGTRLPAEVLALAGEGLLPALLLMMVASIVLGMGLPSAVCYLLMVTLIGPVIGQLGIEPLAAHFFIFYFGMLSMVTPPVALAAYTTAGIAGAPILPTAVTAFRFALAGFALPYFFVFRPELLLIGIGERGVVAVAIAFLLGLASVAALAAGLTGWLRRALSWPLRAAVLVASLLLLWPPPLSVGFRPVGDLLPIPALVGFALLAAVFFASGHSGNGRRAPAAIR